MSGLVVEVQNHTRYTIKETAVETLAAAVLAAEGLTAGELGVTFVGEQRMRTLNRDYREVDRATDVLAFPLEEADELSAPPAEAGRAGVPPTDAGEGGVTLAAVAGDSGDSAATGGPEPPRLLGDVENPIPEAGQVLASGDYRIEIYIEGRLKASGTFKILG